MNSRTRWLALTIVAAVIIAAATVYGVTAFLGYQQRQSAASVGAVAADPLAGPRIVFRNTTAGAGYGHVAAVPLADHAGPRSVTEQTCDRVYETAKNLVCLRVDRGVVTTFEGMLFDSAGKKLRSWPLPGIPSRTRLSPDSRLVASTAFVTGMSYATVGFSTQTVIAGTDGHQYGNLEDFTTTIDDRQLTATDRNFWGVTFSDDGNTFYATAASGGRTWLVRGNLAERTMTAVHPDAECPSLSPDGRHVAYKKNVSTGPVSFWAVAVLDLESGDERVVAEKHSVDDQVEWLDNDNLLYGLPRAGAAGDSDIWRIPIDGTSPPTLYIKHAWSPSVLRE